MIFWPRLRKGVTLKGNTPKLTLTPEMAIGYATIVTISISRFGRNAIAANCKPNHKTNNSPPTTITTNHRPATTSTINKTSLLCIPRWTTHLHPPSPLLLTNSKAAVVLAIRKAVRWIYRVWVLWLSATTAMKECLPSRYKWWYSEQGIRFIWEGESLGEDWSDVPRVGAKVIKGGILVYSKSGDLKTVGKDHVVTMIRVIYFRSQPSNLKH